MSGYDMGSPGLLVGVLAIFPPAPWHESVGNLVSRTSGSQQYRYWWNSVGQLTAVVNPAGDSEAYGYNGLGMRVRRTQAGVTTRYLYDGDDLAAEVDVNGNPIRTYRYWPGIDQPHSMRQNGTTHYYALDLPSSNVRGLFNASSAVTARYEYGPYGEPQGATGTNQPLRFAARELDATAGLYYVRARWYDAGMGRFISEDPIGLAGGINNYAYALNDPVNLSDQTGLCAGSRFNADTTTCLLGGVTSTGSPFNINSMIDQVFSLSVRGATMAGVVFGGRADGSLDVRKASAEVKDWNECVASTTNENFIATHEGFGFRKSRENRIQRRSALARSATESVLTTLSLEAGIGLGSVLVGLELVLSNGACTLKLAGTSGLARSGSGRSHLGWVRRICCSSFRGIHTSCG